MERLTDRVTENNNLLAEAIVMPSTSWTKQHIEAMPKKFIIDNVSSFRLMHIWNDLPSYLQQDPEIINHLPCMEHYNRDDEPIHIDGPPPPKYRCRGCRMERLKSEKKK